MPFWRKNKILNYLNALFELSQCVDTEIVFNSVIKREPLLLHTFVNYCTLKNWSTEILHIPKFKGALAPFRTYYSMQKAGFSFFH